jgi:hypothetical protein
MENKGYMLIQDWMLDLPLTLVETAVYAVIYGFSQDGETAFKGSLSFIARKCKSSKDTARRALRKLADHGYITLEEVRINGVVFNTYKVAHEGCMMRGGVANCKEGGSKLPPNNNIENKDIYTINNKAASRFIAPTLAEVEAYCRERGNSVNAEHFVSHYESNGWMVGKNRMKDWKAAVRTWEQRDMGTPRTQRPAAREKMTNRQRLDRMAAQILGGFGYADEQ